MLNSCCNQSYIQFFGMTRHKRDCFVYLETPTRRAHSFFLLWRFATKLWTLWLDLTQGVVLPDEVGHILTVALARLQQVHTTGSRGSLHAPALLPGAGGSQAGGRFKIRPFGPFQRRLCEKCPLEVKSGPEIGVLMEPTASCVVQLKCSKSGHVCPAVKLTALNRPYLVDQDQDVRRT